MTPNVRLKEGWKFCECGCGTPIKERDKFKRPRKFASREHALSVRKSTKRKSLKIYMSLSQARRIAGYLGAPRKMPGWGYGLDAFKCIKGSELAEDPNSTCHDCYARKNLYLWKGVREAHDHRMEAIEHPRWIEAMVELISHHCKDEPWFRWHDSGDLMSVEHLGRICEIAEQTPTVTHWLPTREYDFVNEFLEMGGEIPSNLVIRLSAYYIDKKPEIPQKLLQVLPTSTTHSGHGTPLQISHNRRDSVECKAYTRGNRCGNCRACWDPRVRNISYPKH